MPIKLIAGIAASFLLPWKRNEGLRMNCEMMGNQIRINGDPVPPFISSHRFQDRVPTVPDFVSDFLSIKTRHRLQVLRILKPVRKEKQAKTEY